MKRFAIAILAALAAFSSSGQTTNITGTIKFIPDISHNVVSADGSHAVFERWGAMLNWTNSTGASSNYAMNAVAALYGVALTNGASYDLDLSSATNSFGTPIAFARVLLIAVSAATNNNADDVVVGDGEDAVAIFGDTNHTAKVRTGGLLVWAAPRRASTNDITGIVSTGKFLRVANPGTNVWTNRVDIFIGGVQ